MDKVNKILFAKYSLKSTDFLISLKHFPSPFLKSAFFMSPGQLVTVNPLDKIIGTIAFVDTFCKQGIKSIKKANLWNNHVFLTDTNRARFVLALGFLRVPTPYILFHICIRKIIMLLLCL